MILEWDPSPEPAVAGYHLFYGTTSGAYSGQIQLGAITQYTITLPDGTYYFAVRAYTLGGSTSAFSNEVVAVLGPIPAPISSCTTPDPFTAMGGGTCFNGGWLPPGMLPAIESTAPAPAPAPSPTPTPSPSGSGSCTTPDPFTAMGGGTCHNGGWLPPGMLAPSNTTAPAPAPSPAPTPTPSPSGSGSCATPDPFAAMGGGTCHNGGWLPPGMVPPSGTTVAGASPQPSSPTPPPSPVPTGDCTTPDPFVAMGGGTCYNGGWLPPGMTPGASSASEPAHVEVSMTGTLRLVSGTASLWFIEGDDGQMYSSPTVIPEELLLDGARVAFVGIKLSTSPDGSTVVEILMIEIQP